MFVELQSSVWGLLASGLVATSAPALVRPLFVLAQQLEPATGALLVVWYASVGIAGLRRHGFPRLLCWLALVLALWEVGYSFTAVVLGGPLFRGFGSVEDYLGTLGMVALSVWMLSRAKVRVTEVSSLQGGA